MTTIKHNKYDAAGNIIGTFDVQVTPSNETGTDIYITDKWLRDRAKTSQPGTKTASAYDGYDKAVWYKPEQGEPVRIKSMECKRSDNSFDVEFTRLNGQKTTICLPV